MMKRFFPMPVGDALFIIALLVFSFVSFLPWSQRTTWNGMAMLGWMMALLMVLSPSIALFRLLVTDRTQTPGSDKDSHD